MPILNEILPASLSGPVELSSVLKLVLLCVAAIMILGAALRAMFGKNSQLIRATSASVTVVMIYLTAILLYVVPDIRELVPELPLLTVTKDAFYLWNPTQMATEALYPAMLRLFVLGVITNFIDTSLPRGRTIMSWYIVRMTGVAGSMALYMGIGWALDTWVPRFYGDLAQPILLGLWGFILLTGIVRWLMTLVLTAMNPVVGVLYGIFFKNRIGQEISKSILTTLLVLAFVTVLCSAGLGSFAFQDFSFAAYGPACITAAVVMYLFGSLLK